MFDVSAKGTIYVSKKDIDTSEYVQDCNFVLYDESGKIIDSWSQDDSMHVLNVDFGSYKLVENLLVMDVFNTGLSQEYFFNINNDDILELTLYNSKIETPRNLGFRVTNIYGFLLILIGCIIVYFSRKFYFC